jgi:hypothetical protein
VGVVQEPVDGGRGQGFGHQLVKGCRVEVGRDGHRAFLVRGIDQAVQAFSGVLRDGQQPYVINDDQIGSQHAGDGLGHGVVGAVAAQQSPEVFEGEPRHA